MTTPVSAATPASAMNPTDVATDTAWPSIQMSQKPPTSANGTVDISSSASAAELKVRNNSTKMTTSVTGMTVRSLAAARSRYSNWPDHAIE